MHILAISMEIIEMIVDFIKWIIGKFSRRPKITPLQTPDVEQDTPSSLLSMMVKPVEPILLLFTKHGIILLALLVVYGLMVNLQLDSRLGIFFIGIIFALGGAGNLVSTRKDKDQVGCVRSLLYAMSVSILLFGVLVSMGALLLMIIGVPVNSSGM